MRLTLLICLCLLVALSALAQNVVLPNNKDSCPVDYLLIDGICVSGEALREMSLEDLRRQIDEAKGKSAATAGDDEPTLCDTRVTDDDGDILTLANGAVIEKTGGGYLGYLGYRKQAILIEPNGPTKIVIEGKDRIYSVRVLRPPETCSSVSFYTIDAEANDEKFVINGEIFEAKTYCIGWHEDHRVVFLEGSPYGTCTSATLLNLDRLKICNVWCE